MKRLTGWILLIGILLMSAYPALAVDNSRSYTFDLAVNGQHEIHVVPEEVITVVFSLNRDDSPNSYTMYAMQNEIHYDDEFLEIIENGSIVTSEVETRDIGLLNGDRSFYMNYVSFADGVEWNANQIVGSFQLKIKGTTGATVLSNNNYKVSLRDGSDVYQSIANDLTLIVSTECTVHFETNGGSEIPDQIVAYGEPMPTPEAPIREGYHVDGWYSDIDLTQQWDFETMPVVSNMTLYAKWAEGNPSNHWWQSIIDWFKNLFDGFNLSGIGDWISENGKYILIGLLPLAAAAMILLLLFKRNRKVIFMVNGGAPIDPIKIKRGESLKDLPIPVRGYSVFCGWYKDEKLTDPWYADVDKVNKRKTKLYAKWL